MAADPRIRSARTRLRLAAEDDFDRADCILLVDTRMIDPHRALLPDRRRRALALGVDDSRERSMLLAYGYGDALGGDYGLDEIAARAGRVLAAVRTTVRRHGRLTLDPLARQAAVDGSPLRLFPREFTLLWRLSDQPGVSVPRVQLLNDVLGLTIEPRTNGLAVHICRLRRKLHAARLSHLLVTGPGDGGYALMLDPDPLFDFGRRNLLDGGPVSGEDGRLLEEAAE